MKSGILAPSRVFLRRPVPPREGREGLQPDCPSPPGGSMAATYGAHVVLVRGAICGAYNIGIGHSLRRRPGPPRPRRRVPAPRPAVGSEFHLIVARRQILEEEGRKGNGGRGSPRERGRRASSRRRGVPHQLPMDGTPFLVHLEAPDHGRPMPQLGRPRAAVVREIPAQWPRRACSPRVLGSGRLRRQHRARSARRRRPTASTG
jgi:hypothetical protein